MKIKFLTDSTADIPPDVAARMGITVMPVFINIGDESLPDHPDYLPRAAYYERLPHLKPLPTTAAPSPGVAQQYIERAFEGADHLVIVALPQRLSATYEVLHMVGNEILPPDRVTYIDSTTMSMAQGYQVIIGAEVAAETGDLAQVLDAMARVRAHVRLAGLIDTLSYLRRGGRVNFASAGLGTLLQIKPIITVEEYEVRTLSRVRTTQRARQDLVRLAHEQAPLDRLTLIHSNNPEGLSWLRDALADIAPPHVDEVLINTAMGTHTGPNCLGFITLRKAWRQ